MATFSPRQSLQLGQLFYAIIENLTVTVDGRRIDDSNIVEQFEWCKGEIEHERDEIDYEHTLDCFKSIETIINSDHSGKENIPEFGEVDWFLRVSDDINYKAVAISRESGCHHQKALQIRKIPQQKTIRYVCFCQRGTRIKSA